MSATSNSTRCTVRWTLPVGAPLINRYNIKIVQCEDSFKVITDYTDLDLYQNYSWNAVMGQHYVVDCTLLTLFGDVVIARGTCVVKTHFSKDELILLFVRATLFSEKYTWKNRIDVVYRCKPRRYFQNILSLDNGVMRTYCKDNNGHAGNPINQSLNGLFFSGQVYNNGATMNCSPFGDSRFTVPAHIMLDPRYINLYFSDFYCLPPRSKTHYVTIVLCNKGSISDRWCAERLILLPPDNNFLEIRWTKNRFEYYISGKIWVEFYYTEDIHLNVGSLGTILPMGRGSSRSNGIRNNHKCKTCNLQMYPN
uniref:PHYHIP_C domain-containing protein n=1 Tax=Panagrellus redivivus TaxID=6233 RepID=A0A7E4ZWR9_PANRE